MKNGQSKETDNTWYTRHRTETNKTKETTSKTIKISNTDQQKTWGEALRL